MKYPLPIIAGFVLALLIIVFVIVPNMPGPYDDFAKCLNDKGAKMYGTFWCSHCKDQKEMFGNSWKHVNYIECSTPDGKGQTEICAAEGIRGYPTWEFPDGERASGLISFQERSEKTGCTLN